MMNDARTVALDKVTQRWARDGRLGGLAVSVESGDRTLAWQHTSGDLAGDRPFFIASATKLYTTALVLREVDAGRLRLEDRLVDRVPAGLCEGLHVRRGVDRSASVTLAHLMAHTSGLPDYFSTGLERVLTKGQDRAWSLADVLADARRLGAVFEPGAARALYSDTNYQLLGAVVEHSSGRRLDDLYREAIFEPLGLTSTWLYADPTDARPTPIRHAKKTLPIPRAMTSFGPDGGIVSTAPELMRFLRAFFDGRLFSARHLPAMQRDWQRIFFPFEYGLGIMRFRLPRLFSPFRAMPTLVGHSGLSGAFAFHCPEKDLYFAGTVNQMRPPSLSFRMMLQLALA